MALKYLTTELNNEEGKAAEQKANEVYKSLDGKKNKMCELSEFI